MPISARTVSKTCKKQHSKKINQEILEAAFLRSWVLFQSKGDYTWKEEKQILGRKTRKGNFQILQMEKFRPQCTRSHRNFLQILLEAAGTALALFRMSMATVGRISLRIRAKRVPLGKMTLLERKTLGIRVLSEIGILLETIMASIRISMTVIRVTITLIRTIMAFKQIRFKQIMMLINQIMVFLTITAKTDLRTTTRTERQT